MADISIDFENARAAARESQSVGDDVKSSVAGVDDSCNDAALGLLVGPLVTPPLGLVRQWARSMVEEAASGATKDGDRLIKAVQSFEECEEASAQAIRDAAQGRSGAAGRTPML